MGVDLPETLAAVVCLLRQAAMLAWAAVDRAGAGSPGQLFALGVDLAADQARHLVPDGTDVDGPVPVGDEPADLPGRLTPDDELGSARREAQGGGIWRTPS